MSIMEIKQVGYSYDNKKKVLKGVNAEMEQGKLYAILGPSGCGKTTLLSLIGGLDSPGSVFRMNHASNYLVLKGTLNRDKEAMLRTIDAAEHDLSRLRPEEWRGL